MLCIIGGSGLDSLQGIQADGNGVETPYGKASSELHFGTIDGAEFAFIPRHGMEHSIPPHQINYRANIHLVKSAGIKNILSVAAVGSLKLDWCGGELVIPDQLIDYTWGRAQCFSESNLHSNSHYDFTDPFCPELQKRIIQAADYAKVCVHQGATYGVTQGPRLETAAEIRRLSLDGCDLVGMTAMPEAGLAREAGLCYASLAVIANLAAGIGDAHSLTMENIHQQLSQGMANIGLLLPSLIREYSIT